MSKPPAPLRRSCHLILALALIGAGLLTILAAPVSAGRKENKLVTAARDGETDKVLALLKKGADIEAKDVNGWGALMYAIDSGRTETVKALLEKGANPGALTKYGGAPLNHAINLGLPDIVKALLDKGADPEARHYNGQTALEQAIFVSKGRSDIVRALLEKGVELEGKDTNGMTPLRVAIMHGHTEIVRALLDKGADFESKGKNGLTPLQWAFGKSEISSLIEAKLGPRSPTRMAELIAAAKEGRTDVVTELLNAGVDVEAKDDMGETALLEAATNGHADIVKILLDKGADIEAKNVIGATALIAASGKGHTDTVKSLLEKGANTKAKDTTLGWTALRNAVVGGHTETARALLDKGANVEESCLLQAASAGHVEIVKALLDKGADVEAQAKDGATALILARREGHRDVVALLQQRGAGARPQGRAGAQAPAQEGLSKQEMQRLAQEAAKEALATQAVEAERQKPKPAVIHSDADKPKYKAPESANNFAVVIGIDKYRGSLPEAQFAERDAQAVRAHLAALGYPPRNIRLLIGSEGTRGDVVKNIETWLPRMVREESTVFVYFSGHGAPDVQTGQAYLVPWDGDPEFLEDTAYSVKRLYQKLGTLKAQRIIVALDSCFSGAGGRSVLAKGTRPLVSRLDTGQVAGGKILVLSAAQGNQISGTIDDQGHGAFTYHLLSGLNGGAADVSGQVSVKGLFEYLLPKVQDEASRHNRDQTPELMPSGAAEAAAFRLR